MASSSSVQFKKFLFNQVDDIAGNEVSPTKQARGDCKLYDAAAMLIFWPTAWL